MAATDNDALLKAMDQLMKEEDRASVIEYAKQLSTKGGDVVGTMRKMSQQGVDTKKEAAMWKKRAILTVAVAVVVCAVMFGLMVAATEVSKETRVYSASTTGTGRRLDSSTTGITEANGKGHVNRIGGAGIIVEDSVARETLAAGAPGGSSRRLEDSIGTNAGDIEGFIWSRTTRRLNAEGEEETQTTETYSKVGSMGYERTRRLADDGEDGEKDSDLEITFYDMAGNCLGVQGTDGTRKCGESRRLDTDGSGSFHGICRCIEGSKCADEDPTAFVCPA